MKLWQPLLAATPKNEKHWKIIEGHLPLMMQTKIDGVRIVVKEGVLRKRKLDPVLNRHMQKTFGSSAFDGLDGEAIYGPPDNPDVYRVSNSNMKLDGSPDMTFYVWDDFTHPRDPYSARYARASDRVFEQLERDSSLRIQLLENHLAYSIAEARAMSEGWEVDGYEGGMGKLPRGEYKTGRSTINEGLVIKFKSFEDQEATIIGFTELHSNQNEAVEDNRGYSKRSSHKENQVPMNTMGALWLKGDPEWVKEFKCGSGFDAALRKEIWNNQEKYLGKKITFKFQRTGSFEAPRIPIFRRFYEGS